jgi:transposase
MVRVARRSELYEIEPTMRGQPSGERLRVRQKHSLPLVEVLQAWLDLQLSRLSGRSRLAEAIHYALGGGQR